MSKKLLFFVLVLFCQAAFAAQEKAEIFVYSGHTARSPGLFTYVLAEGLKGKADADRDGFIKTTELANYVDDEVPALAEKVFRHKQYPIASPSGMGFPVARAR